VDVLFKNIKEIRFKNYSVLGMMRMMMMMTTTIDDDYDATQDSHMYNVTYAV